MGDRKYNNSKSSSSKSRNNKKGTKKKMEARNEYQTIKRYNTLYALTTLIGVVCVVMVTIWCSHYRGGFAWSSAPAQQFNWHPVLMVFGMLFIYSQSMLIYRTNRARPKKTLKLLHATLHFVAFICTVIGLQAVFDFHNKMDIPNMYSIHSWLGLGCVIIFSLQFFIGFVTFLLPYASKQIRQFTLPVHVAFGTATFVLCAATALMGLNEKAIFSLGDDYKKLTSEAMLINFIGVLLAIFATLSLYLVHEPAYKRLALPEEELALTESSD